MSRHADTIAALATPAGTAALAVLRASGPDTRRIATELGGRTPLPRLARHVDYHARDGVLLDDVLLTFFAGPKSYTGEDALEISCHGNPFIAQKILEDLFARGCRPAEPGEFTQRAFLNGRMDLSQAEAVMDVIHARSERALAAANQQLRGSLTRWMDDLVSRLLSVLARVEAYIDFPDEDLPAEDRTVLLEDVRRLATDTARLLATRHYGDLLREGIRTVIVGEPNAGKSSVLNRLVGRERSIVSDEPGTTRDFIEERVLLNGHSFRLIDTAGLNPAPGAVEKLGIEKTHEQLQTADIVLVVVDGSLDLPRLPPALQRDELVGRVVAYLLNKSDVRESTTLDGYSPTLSLSAKTGAGFEQLTAWLAQSAEQLRKETGSEFIAVNARHARALREAEAGLSRATENIQRSAPTELLASELRGVLAAYGEITGRIDNERMLDHLFATFCIGK